MKVLALRRDDECESCGSALPAGTRAYWFTSERVTRCLGCVEHSADPPQPVHDVAGASATAEYQKRSARERQRQEQAVNADAEWRQDVKRRHRFLGPVVTAFTPKPVIAETQATAAWKTGAEGEERVAEVLADVAGIEVLHDRRWPGTRSGNIDHIVVGPSGVFVVDAKKYEGKLELVDRGSLFRPDVRLHVNGRNRTKLIDGLLAQVEAVRATRTELADVPVSGVLCFVGADWGLFGPRKPKFLNGVTIVWPLKLPDIVSAPGPVDVATVAANLRSGLPPARKA